MRDGNRPRQKRLFGVKQEWQTLGQFHFAWALLGVACLFAVPAAAAPQEAADSAVAYLQAVQKADGATKRAAVRTGVGIMWRYM